MERKLFNHWNLGSHFFSPKANTVTNLLLVPEMIRKKLSIYLVDFISHCAVELALTPGNSMNE